MTAITTATIKPPPDRFPPGTVVGAYRANAWSGRDRSVPPTGAADTTATVASNGSLAFSGLTDQTGYLAWASGSGPPVTFSTRHDYADDLSQGVGSSSDSLLVQAASGATPTVDMSLGTVQDITLSANATIAFTGASAGKACSFLLILRQDATGGRTVTWPASVKWSVGAAPVLSTGAGKVDMLSFLSVDGGTTWLGSLAGADLR